MELNLPPFLSLLEVEPSPEDCIHSIFRHSNAFGSSKTLWWPNEDPKTLIMFIPGNPGLSEFYIPFLSALYKSSISIVILAQSLLGHTEEAGPTPSTDLFSQVAVAIETFDTLAQAYPDAKTIIIGHSVGCWIASQVLKARPDKVDSLFLLFPTITNILDTPNGHSLSWAFRPPFPYFISKLSLLLRLLPPIVLSTVFREWPETQLDVLRRLLQSPACIRACLHMAHEEMMTIRELDIDLLQTHRHRIHMYFAETDGWVGKNKDLIVSSFDPGAIKVVHGEHGIPHAFCINHGQELADQCTRWMSTL